MNTPADTQKDWSKPKPEKTTAPTYIPVVLAAGIVVFAWGLIFSPWFVALGAGLFVAGLAGWIRALQRDVESGSGSEYGALGEGEKGSVLPSPGTPGEGSGVRAEDHDR